MSRKRRGALGCALAEPQRVLAPTQSNSLLLDLRLRLPKEKRCFWGLKQVSACLPARHSFPEDHLHHWTQPRYSWGVCHPCRPEATRIQMPPPAPGLSTHRRTLRQLLRGRYLHIEVFGLRLSSRLDEPLKYLVWGEKRESQKCTKSERQVLVRAGVRAPRQGEGMLEDSQPWPPLQRSPCQLCTHPTPCPGSLPGLMPTCPRSSRHSGCVKGV